MTATTTASHQWLVFFGGHWESLWHAPSGKHRKNYGRSAFLIGKSTIFMGISNSHVCLPEGNVGDGDGFN